MSYNETISDSFFFRALGQNPTESEVKKLVHEHRADERVTFEVFLPILQVS